MFKEINEKVTIDQLLELYPPLNAPQSVRGNLVLSINGSVTSKGKSKELSSSVDRVIFHHLRAVSSFILVGAKTAISEPYGPAGNYPKYLELRSYLGLEPTPKVVVVANATRSLAPLYQLGTKDNKALVFVPNAGIVTDTPESVEIIEIASDRPLYKEVIKHLKERSQGTILCEGGPTLLSQLIDHDQVDELCLTMSPHLISKDDHTPFVSFRAHSPTLHSIATEGTHLYLRYRMK